MASLYHAIIGKQKKLGFAHVSKYTHAVTSYCIAQYIAIRTVILIVRWPVATIEAIEAGASAKIEIN